MQQIQSLGFVLARRKQNILMSAASQWILKSGEPILNIITPVNQTQRNISLYRHFIRSVLGCLFNYIVTTGWDTIAIAKEFNANRLRNVDGLLDMHGKKSVRTELKRKLE